MLGFNGGLMGVRRTPTGSAASGLWFQNEQSVARRADIWPSVLLPNQARYFRLASFANTALDSNALDFGEIEVYDGNTKHTGITCTSNITWSGGQDSFLTDGITSTSARAYIVGWSSIQSTATITLDLGTTKTVTHIKIFTLYGMPRFPASFDLQSSADNVTYATVATVTVGSSFTDLGNSSYSSEKVAI
jgi:hypothetical protein